MGRPWDLERHEGAIRLVKFYRLSALFPCPHAAYRWVAVPVSSVCEVFPPECVAMVECAGDIEFSSRNLPTSELQHAPLLVASIGKAFDLARWCSLTQAVAAIAVETEPVAAVRAA